jgi:biotin transport system permease protein
MVNRQTVFKYKTIKGFLHKIPAVLKLFLLLPLSIFCMSLSSCNLAIGIAATILLAFLCRFSPLEQITDIKPAFYYAILMYALSAFSNLLENWNALSLAVLIPRPEFVIIALRLVLIVQLSALLFRTTSSIELKDGLNSIEQFIRRLFSGKKGSYRTRFTDTISLFLRFIPEIFETWTNVNLAWKARNGKQGFAKIKPLVVVIISLSFEKAAGKAKAIAARGG